MEDHVAASRDPDAIAKEIEQTRAELAAAVDAIAQRVSPKRVASRGAAALQSPTGRMAGAAGVILVVAVFLIKRRSRRSR
jgi:hypothetical protein